MKVRKVYFNIFLIFCATYALAACSKQSDADQLLGGIFSSSGSEAGPLLLSTPSTKDFGSVATNSNSTQSFTLTNSGSVNATTQTLSVTGTGFSIFQNTCTGVTIKVGGTCTFTILFAPSTVGAKTGTTVLTYTAATGGTSYTMSISLSGTGISSSVAFSFFGFNLGVGAHTSSLTPSGVVLNWALATGGTPAYYKITQTVLGVSTATNAIAASRTTYNITGLTFNTTYTFQINAYDALGVSDGNSNTITFATPNATGSNFSGWSDLIATGTTVTNINAISAALLAASVVPSLATTNAQVKLAWELFTFTPAGPVADGYNIYRSLTSGAGFALIGTSATLTYIDTTPLVSTTYYYKIQPTILGIEYTSSVADDSEIQVFVPPANMALVHR